VRIELVPRDTWDAVFCAEGAKSPLPRIRMLDGFNEGWIRFGAPGAVAMKGQISTR
jgi:hypothetical protein